MKFTKLAIAVAVASAFSASAFADEPLNSALITNSTEISNAVYVSGEVAVKGTINVSNESAAVTDNSQASVGNLVITIGGGNDATVTNGTGNNASGNIGVNVSSGTGNAQSNQAAIASLDDAASVFSSAQTFSTQVSAVNVNVALLTNNKANLIDSFNGAAGNVGVNIASGSGNMQDNQLAVAVVNSSEVAGRSSSNGGGWYPPPASDPGAIAKATSSNQQLVGLTLNGDADCNMTNTALVAGSLQGATGNIGVNVTAGYGNLQHNSLAISSAK